MWSALINRLRKGIKRYIANEAEPLITRRLAQSSASYLAIKFQAAAADRTVHAMKRRANAEKQPLIMQARKKQVQGPNHSLGVPPLPPPIP